MFIVTSVNNDDGLKLGGMYVCENFEDAVDKVMEWMPLYDDSLDIEECREYVETDYEYVSEDGTWGIFIGIPE